MSKNKSKISITPCTEFYKKKWDEFVLNANNGTIFHCLDFVSYHGTRFTKNERPLIFLKGESLYGVFPFAIFNKNQSKFGQSPYGASYGGPVFYKELNYSESVKVVQEMIEYFKQNNLNEVSITLPLPCYKKTHSDTFYLVLYENNFKCTNRDISSIVDIKSNEIELLFTSKVRNTLCKARDETSRILMDASIKDFWPLLEMTYERHGTNPTHTYDELNHLSENLKNIRFEVAWVNNEPAAGICHFIINSRCVMTFYMTTNPKYKSTQALSLLISESMLYFQNKGYRWYDFGTSSVQMHARPNIFKFKERFGSVGQFRETYKWSNQ